MREAGEGEAQLLQGSGLLRSWQTGPVRSIALCTVTLARLGFFAVMFALPALAQVSLYMLKETWESV